MVRSSVISAVSSACAIRLVPDWRCFWSTNSKCTSSLAVPGAAATPCVDQLVSSTQKAEPQDAWAGPAESSSARLPEQAIEKFLIIFLLLRSSPARRFRGRARATTVRAQPYLVEQRKSGGEGRGARRRGEVERGLKLRLGEKLQDLPAGGRREEER